MSSSFAEIHSLLHKDPNATMLPRRYQEEVFVRAQKGNIIAALDTGSGKTFISVLLIKWMAVQETSRGKVIIFVVPKVPLVEQQGNFIAKYASLRVLKLHGALDIDLSDRPGWKHRFESHDVFVMTAQIFLNLLTHSLWSMGKVSLIIFDECHHARKNHPYNGILREYFQISPRSRPKVFGMTASPIWDPKDAAGSLAALEANMDAKVIGVREHINELASNSPKPVEMIKEYPHPLETYDYPSPTIYECLSAFESVLWDQLDVPWYNIEMRYFYTLNNLGPYAASLFLFLELQNHVVRISRECKASLFAIDDEDAVFDMLPSAPQRLVPSDFFAIEEILLRFEEFFSTSSSFDIPLSIPLSWCTPKIKVLTDVLLAYQSPTFQGIIFVEQRQIAACLARILPSIPELQGLIRCSYLLGQSTNSDGVSKVGYIYPGDPVKLFRDRTINILIATSVAEEGLDFPACDLVVRFDPLQHMVGYVQSRGRARNKASTFVLMIQKDDVAQLTRYKALQEGEPEVNRVYRTRHNDTEDEEMESDDEDTDSVDLRERERFVVASTGAILSYDNAISLLNHLCALVPRDAFTPVHIPKYSGNHQAVLRLPRGLPLAPQHLTFLGPLKRSKKEAKRAVAFRAVRRLHALDVFDDYLLPVSSKGDLEQDDSGKGEHRVRNVPVLMTVSVRDPWTMGPKLWMHPVFISEKRVAGLVTGTLLPSVELRCGMTPVRIEGGVQLAFDEEEEYEQRATMNEFTKLGVWYRITASPFTASLSLFLVPVTDDFTPDFDAMGLMVQNPYGCEDWSGIGEDDYDRLLVMNKHEVGRVRLLKRVRHDLSPLSVPPPGSKEENSPTYREFFIHRWTRKKYEPNIPEDGPLMETVVLQRSQSGMYTVDVDGDNADLVYIPDCTMVPQRCCRWIPMSHDIYRAFELLPALCRRVTDIYRNRTARFSLGLPPIADSLLLEALTLPCATAQFSNQRLETLGDAVLQLCTTVHLLNHYPNRHEGQLSVLRQHAVNNMHLLKRAKEVGLEHFLTSEIESVYKWRYILPPNLAHQDSALLWTTREYPRRSLQDSMEAILGASFVTGGIDMALQAGTALGLTFGGSLPWQLRYRGNPVVSPTSGLFASLQERLGYTFKQHRLLLEAVTHPSFVESSDCPSYQRLEFLGDALLDLVVVDYLYRKFPDATSHGLALPRTKAICAPALAYLAVRTLQLHKVMLLNNVELNMAIDRYVPLLEAASDEEIVKRGWRYDPPKAISDVFESVIGAVFVDSGYDYEKAAAVVEHVMKGVLGVLSPSIAKDPVSELTEWMAGSGCNDFSFKKMQKQGESSQIEGIALTVHKSVLVGPIVSKTLNVARFIAAERALAILKDPSSERNLSCICDCMKVSLSMNSETVPLLSTLTIRESPSAISGSTVFDNDFLEIQEVAMVLTQGL